MIKGIEVFVLAFDVFHRKKHRNNHQQVVSVKITVITTQIRKRQEHVSNTRLETGSTEPGYDI